MAEVLRKTRGTCPVCVKMVPAEVLEDENHIYIEKNCPEHGLNRALLAIDAAYYKELEDYFFSLHTESSPQRDYILRLTGRCNMNCPICLASANEFPEEDLTQQKIEELTGSGRRLKLDLMGAEPTLRTDLEEIMRKARAGGHINALHSNGIKLGDPDYVKRLVDAGLDEVHLQFDGFSDEHDLSIRGQLMNDNKRKALAALKLYDVATDLVVTVAQGSNEDQMIPTLDYAARNSFVKEVFYLGCRRLGRATHDYADQCLVPDEVLEILIDKTGGRINRNDMRAFQKLYFALLKVFKVRKCFYIHHYLVTRRNNSWRPVSEEMDLPYLERKLDRLVPLLNRSRLLGGAWLGIHAAVSILRKRSFRLLVDGAALSTMLMLGFDLSRVKRRPILLGFITACDPWIYDEQIAAHCGKGELSSDLGHHESGALANVSRERLHLDTPSDTGTSD